MFKKWKTGVGVLKRIKFCGSFSCGIFLQECFFAIWQNITKMNSHAILSYTVIRKSELQHIPRISVKIFFSRCLEFEFSQSYDLQMHLS